MKKIIAVILSIAMLLGFSVPSTASPVEKIENSFVYVNPLYADVVSEEEIAVQAESGSSEEKEGITLFSETPVYVETIEEAAEILRKQLCERKELPVVYFRAPEYSENDIYLIFAKALEHTGDPVAGDYLQWSYGGFYAGVSGTDYGTHCDLVFTYQPLYYTTAEQEAELAVEIEKILSSFKLSGKNDYEKVKVIYDYICENVTYDYDNLYDNDYKLKFTAYAAVMNKTAVCQGYAALLYRLALSAGVDSRLIAGTSFNDNHGWNIVKLGDYYYNLDSTWDAGSAEYDYFLLCEKNFVNHTRFPEYDTEEFHAEYPIGESDYVYNEDDFGEISLIASGYCGGEGDGTNLEWKLTEDGTLIISGTGAMANYSYIYAPWFEYSNKIKTLVFEEGITSISAYAFYGLSKITGDLIIPDTVVSIGSAAFYNCSGFNGNLVLSNKLESIGDMAFAECGGFKGDLVIPDSVTYLGESAFKYCLGFDGELVIGNSVEAIYMDTFNQCMGFTGDLAIPDSVTYIGDWAFYGCAGFSGSLYIGNGVTEISQSAFSNCRGFKGNLILGENLKIIGVEAFSNCIGFKGDLIIPDSITDIWSYAFNNCKGFDGKLVMSENVVIIGSKAFYNCAGFSGEVIFPESLENIEEQAFYKCGIDDYYFKGDAPSVTAAFESYPTFDSDDTIYYPAGNDTWEIVDGKWKGYTAVGYISGIYGDINGDGRVNVYDAYEARLIAAKLVTPTEEQKEFGDVDGDGRITAIDANYIRKFAVNIISVFPVE